MVFFTSGVFYFNYLPLKKMQQPSYIFFPPPLSYDKQNNFKNIF